jgi:hypothetical protein
MRVRARAFGDNHNIAASGAALTDFIYQEEGWS